MSRERRHKVNNPTICAIPSGENRTTMVAMIGGVLKDIISSIRE
jgi:hypothetical protein